MRAQDLAEQHARQNDVVRELRLTDALRTSIDFAKGLTDDVQWDRIYRIFHDLKDSIQSVDALSRELKLFTTHASGREFDRLVNLDITRATAQIP